MHAKGRCGIMHHPTSRVKVILREMNDERAEGFSGRYFGRKTSEIEHLLTSLKRHRLFRFKDDQPLRYSHDPWSTKPWKYVTSKKWTNPNSIIRLKR